MAKQPFVTSKEPSSRDAHYAENVSATIKAYRSAARELLSGKYSDVRELAPSHLREPCNVTVLVCTDGMLVRHDATTAEATKVRTAIFPLNLAELAPRVTDALIHCPTDPSAYDPGPAAIEFHLGKFKVTPDVAEPITTLRPLIYLSPTALVQSTLPVGQLPRPVLSVTNEMEFVLEGEIASTDTEVVPQALERSQKFVARFKTDLQVAWRGIDIYQNFTSEHWKPEFAALWAETDILAAATRAQLRDAQFAALDPNMHARKVFAELIAKFEVLLEGPEEPAHQFLKANPKLLSATHQKCWSKLPFGERFSDFVFREPGEEYLLVEIESPLRELFRRDGQQRHELTHAWNQILDWRSYLENNLSAARENLGLSGISANPKSLIVIGRSAELSDENRRKLATMQSQVPNLKILTYDDLIDRAKAVADNLFGPNGMATSSGDVYLVPSGPSL